MILDPSGCDGTQRQSPERGVLHVVFEPLSFPGQARPWTAILEPPLTQLDQAHFRVGRNRLEAQPLSLGSSFQVRGQPHSCSLCECRGNLLRPLASGVLETQIPAAVPPKHTCHGASPCL